MLANSLAREFVPDVSSLPFLHVVPFTASNYPLGLDVLSPVESKQDEARLAKLEAFIRACKRSHIDFVREDGRNLENFVRALVVAYKRAEGT